MAEVYGCSERTVAGSPVPAMNLYSEKCGYRVSSVAENVPSPSRDILSDLCQKLFEDIDELDMKSFSEERTGADVESINSVEVSPYVPEIFSFSLLGGSQNVLSHGLPKVTDSCNSSQVTSTICASGSHFIHSTPGDIKNPGKIRVGKRHPLLNNFKPEYCVTCPKCGLSVASRGHLKRHLATHGADRSFRCSHCDCSFSRRDFLQDHLARAHKSHHKRDIAQHHTIINQNVRLPVQNVALR
nr:chorion transcription factor Cf2-like [Cherax quadricarinatus]